MLALLSSMLSASPESRPTADEALQILREIQSVIQEPPTTIDAPIEAQSNTHETQALARQKHPDDESKALQLLSKAIAKITTEQMNNALVPVSKDMKNQQQTLVKIQKTIQAIREESRLLKEMQFEEIALQRESRKPKIVIKHLNLMLAIAGGSIIVILTFIATTLLTTNTILHYEPPKQHVKKRVKQDTNRQVKKQYPYVLMEKIHHTQQRFPYSNARAFATNPKRISLITSNNGEAITIINTKKQILCSYTFPKKSLHLSIALWVQELQGFIVGYEIYSGVETHRCNSLCDYNPRNSFSLISVQKEKKQRCRIRKHIAFIYHCCHRQAEPKRVIRIPSKTDNHIILGIFGIKKKNSKKKEQEFLRALYIRKYFHRLKAKIKPLAKEELPQQKFLNAPIDSFASDDNSGLRIHWQPEKTLQITQIPLVRFSSSKKTLSSYRIPGRIQNISIAEPYLMTHSRKEIAGTLHDFFILLKLKKAILP